MEGGGNTLGCVLYLAACSRAHSNTSDHSILCLAVLSHRVEAPPESPSYSDTAHTFPA